MMMLSGIRLRLGSSVTDQGDTLHAPCRTHARVVERKATQPYIQIVRRFWRTIPAISSERQQVLLTTLPQVSVARLF